MIVSHGANSSAKSLSGTFCPYAASYDLILLFPQVDIAWDADGVGYTGPLSNTKNGIHPIFMKQLIEQVTKPIDKENNNYGRPEQPKDEIKSEK
jgi:hypothetical protein